MILPLDFLGFLWEYHFHEYENNFNDLRSTDFDDE